MVKNQKVIVIGLDGATWAILQPLADRGWLPNLKKLMVNGSWGHLDSTIPPVTGPAWVTFATGRNPGSHGCYNFLLPRENLLSIEPIDSTKIKGKVFYEILERAGKKSIIINLPCSSPPRIKNGVFLPSFLAANPQEIYPNKLAKELPSLKEYRVVPDFLTLRIGNVKNLVKDIRKIAKNRFAIAKSLFLKHDWDFFFCLFSGSDWIQHKAYDLLASEELSEKSPPVQVFKDLDRYIGWFANHTNNSSVLILMSDHGFKAPSTYFYINKWLEKNKYLTYKIARPKSPSSLSLTPRQIKNVRVHGFFPNILKIFSTFLINHPFLYLLTGQFSRFLARILPASEYLIPREALNLGYEFDPQTSVAYSLPGNVTGVYINDKMRFKDGLVSQLEYKEILKSIICGLKILKDPAGNPVFKRVYQKKEVYFGKALKMAPDILFEENDDIIVTSEMFRPSVFEQVREGQGWHHEKGIILAFGNNIAKGKKISKANLRDLAPTILTLFDITPEKNMEGNMLFKKIPPPDPKLIKKIVKSKIIIKKAIEKFGINNMALAWTGGKDSTLLLWLVREISRENKLAMPKIVFIDEGDLFEEVTTFVNNLSTKWQLQVDKVKNTDVIKQAHKVGEPIDTIRLNPRNRKELKRIGFQGTTFPFQPESFIGCHLMKTVPLNEYIEKKQINALLTGIRWDEHEARAGENYFSKRKQPRHTRIHPILHFTEKNVWEAIHSYGIPFIRELYGQGYRSLGAKSTTFRTSKQAAWKQDLNKTRERGQRQQDKEHIMERLRGLGYM